MSKKEILLLRKELSSLANKAKELIIQSNQLNSQISFYSSLIRVSKNKIQKYFTNSTPSHQLIKNDLIDYITELKTMKSSNSKRKDDCDFLSIADGLIAKVEKAKEDQFILENLIEQKNVELTLINNEKKNFEHFGMFREDRRDLYNHSEDEVNFYLEKILSKYQERLYSYLHEHNNEINKVNALKNEASNLKTEINENASQHTSSTHLKKNKSITCFTSYSIQKKKIESSNFDKQNEPTESSRFFFRDFEESEIDNTLIDINFEDNVDNNKKHISCKSAIPKLNLKQIEFNKRKIKVTPQEANASNPKEEQRKYLNNPRQSVKKDSIDDKIKTMEENILTIKKTIKNNKQLIRKFKQFYKRKKEEYMLNHQIDENITEGLTIVCV